MFHKILVPLDGSEFADGILEIVRPFAAAGAAIELFRVYEDEADGEAARAHVEQRSQALQQSGAAVSHALACGDPAAQILDRISVTRPDLVAMASRGRIGPARWIRGSVAERVLRHCPTPLLLGQPQGGSFASPSRILVPLDGSSRAQEILSLAISVARIFGAEIVLFRASNAHHVTLEGIVSPVEGREPIPTPQQLADSLIPAQELVASHGVSVRSLTAFGDPAAEILRVAEEEAVDLIALSTHGRTGLSRWLFGSVAEKVFRAARLPMLALRNATSDA